MHTIDTMGYGHKKYRPPISPTNYYQHDMYSRPTTLRPQSEYRFAGGGHQYSTWSGGSRSSGSLCSAALIGGALLAAVAVLGVAALAFYMGALRPDNGEPIISFEGTFRVTRGDVYGGAPDSPAWRERARKYSVALRQIYNNPSTIRQAFAGAIVTGFGDRRLDVHFRLYLDRRKIPSTVSNVEEVLKNILIQDQLSKASAFGQIKIDTTSINIKRDLEHTYHSESYVKEALNESMSGSMPIHSTQNKDKVHQTRIGVVRKTTVKPPSKNKDIHEPDINTDNLPVLQGTFQITKTEADITENKQASTPNKQEEKQSNNSAPPKTTVKPKRIQNSTTPRPKPFTIMSTLNVKSRIESTTPKNYSPKTMSSSTTTTKRPETMVSIETTTNNVSQILLDLLTNENHYKDLPKIDTLFTVPHVVDNEPWRPITRPYYDTTNPPVETHVEQAEDRIGVAEVIEDLSALEGILSPIPPVRNKDKTTPQPISIHDKNPELAADVYVPNPVYTSFVLPTIAPPIKNTETLGSHFPKPHPIPVDKISSVVEEADVKPVLDDNDGKPVERPPKDKTTSTTINVLQADKFDNLTEKIEVEGVSIVKKYNITSSTSTSTSTSTPSSTSSSTTKSTSQQENISAEVVSTTDSIAERSDNIDLDNFSKESIMNSKEQSTKRPNNKVSVIPSTAPPHQTWELVNTSNQNVQQNVRTTPEKFYNETLQAIITKNDAPFPNTTPKFSNKVALLKNLTDIIKRYSQNVTERPMLNKSNEPETRQNNDKMVGSSEVIIEEEKVSTTQPIITLLPAKSNLAGPLRPRPTIKATTVKYENGHFQGSKIEPESQATSNKRFPKTNSELNIIDAESNADNSENRIVTEIPDGTYRVSYHVTGSVSSKQANTTKTLPAYELALEPDVVLEIPINQANSLTTDKLRQLANLATISDTQNDTLFKSPGGIISTKAIPSSYTLNQAGFKILTKTFNKLQSTKNDNYEKGGYDKNYEKEDFHQNKFNGSPFTNEVPNQEDTCNNQTSFRCLSGACISISSRCNRLLDCPGGEDERLCSCADYLRAEFSQSKICDGVVDCWDFSDENKCEWCQENQYVCANAKQCINTDQVCDGIPDCPLGDDEKSCVALTDSLAENEVIPYNEEGFVMIRKKGVWGRLCVESFKDVVTQAHSSLQLPDLGMAVCKSMTFQDSSWSRESREGRKASTAGYWEVWHNSAARAADTRLSFRRSSCAKHRALRVRCSNLECGIRPHADAQQPRVVGGGGAVAGAWPWQAALYRDGEFQCGATLISNEWLLSASHCFYQATEAHWVARLGALRRGAWPRGPWERVVRVRQVILHPRYAPRGFRNDIALLRIDPVALHARLRPACLPPARTQPPAGQYCSVVGWGQLYEHERVFPDTLQEVELPVISTAECRRRTRLLPLYRITDDMFCAGYERGGRDACLGDSGGPLMCQSSDNKWYLYGVTSNGYGCARANRPGVYTKVSNYIDWIDSVIDSNSKANETNDFDSIENFYADLEVAENNKVVKLDSCKGYRCPLGECLPQSSICNGFLECSDGSDEAHCDSNFSESQDPD